MNQTLRDKLNNLPQVPGVYIYKNKLGTVIYVGKAKNLKNRVGSYFLSGIRTETKTYALVAHIESLDYIEAESELEALILESELIKKYRPKYNVISKDDKSYLYIIIRNYSVDINGTKLKLPIVKTARETDLLPKDITFGPYPEGTTAKTILRTVRKIFPFRDCSTAKFNRYQRLHKPCLYGYIGLCSAPCVNQTPKDIENYKNNISRIKRLLSGESSKMLKSLESQMKLYSKNMEYEQAATYRDLLDKFNYVRRSFRSAREYIDNPYLVYDLANDALNDLAKEIPSLTKPPKRIECYDISNISGKEAVGSMVVSVDGRINKNEYKRFKIKQKSTPDDFAMLYEVLTRRLKRSLSINVSDKNAKLWPLPDLLVIDGGKGQVSSVLTAMQELKVQIPIIGLAKKFETIVYYQDNEFIEKRLPKTNAGLKHLIALRDEAHRFAQSYHHKLRLKSLIYQKDQ